MTEHNGQSTYCSNPRQVWATPGVARRFSGGRKHCRIGPDFAGLFTAALGSFRLRGCDLQFRTSDSAITARGPRLGCQPPPTRGGLARRRQSDPICHCFSSGVIPMRNPSPGDPQNPTTQVVIYQQGFLSRLFTWLACLAASCSAWSSTA